MVATANMFFRGNVNAGAYAPFQFEEPGQGVLTFGELAGIRLEGSDGSALAVGLWRLMESTTSPVYTSALGDETFLVLEGEVSIKDLATGEVHRFGVGDIGSWSKGIRTEWTFKAPFKKMVVVAGR